MKNIKGCGVSGKMLSGKGTFLALLKKLVGQDMVMGIGFADKLKLISKWLLVQLSRAKESNSSEEDAVYSVAVLCYKELFDKDPSISLDEIYEKLLRLALAPHTQEYVRPGITMPNIDGNVFWTKENPIWPKKDYGFDDIDALLWSDCGKPRKMLQEIGTEVMRSIKDTVWLDYVFKVTQKHPYFFCISDVRFPNELESSKKNGFLDIRIEASKETRLKRGFERDGQDYSNMLDHPSETSLDNYEFSHTIRNEGSMDELEEALWENKAIADLIGLLRARIAKASLIAC